MILLLDDLLPLISTNMTNEEILDYVAELFPMLRNTTIQTQQIPAANTFENMTVGNVTATKVADMAVNRQILQELLGYSQN